MKVAIAVDKKLVSAHFGRCEEFVLLEVEGSRVVDQKIVKNPGHKPGFLPQFLKELGVRIVIAGGVGKKALGLFEKAQIKVILGITGEVEEVIDRFLKGNLESQESLCKPGFFREEKSDRECHKNRSGKICITSQGNSLDSQADSRFGRCEYFVIFDLENSDYEAIENPYREFPHGAGVKSAQFIVEKGIKALLTGDVGPNAQEILQKGGVDLIKGVSGKIKEIIERFKKGEYYVE